MSNAKEYVKTLTISDLFDDKNKCKYIIPIYQRNYAWGDNEISSLLQDIKNACEQNKEQDKNYYIGSLVVYCRENGDFEVIDGQQRLTTLTLIMHYLGKLNFRNVFFEHRDESEQALSNLNSEKLPSNFSQALEIINKGIHEWGDNKTNFAKFLLEKVEIIRTEVPEGTDLNHYFEIMNTRGEQLEKHEILKARLMKKLPKGIKQSLFAKIWGACSDMSRYVVMGIIEPELRKNIFGEDWTNIPKTFTEIVDNYKGEEKDTTPDVDSQKNGNSESDEPSIISLIGSYNDKIVQSIQNNEFTNGSFNSVIDFPNFLMHVLRIYLEQNPKDKAVRDISLDEKYLLSYFDEEWDKDDVIKFIDVLLSCRYLFDKYVIKSSTLRAEDEHWSLWKIIKGKSSNYYYKNTFGSDKSESNDTDTNKQTKNAIMLLSMFHVSNPSRIYKNWLYAVLRWLFDNKGDIKQSDYIKFLEDLCDKFYFGNNCQEKDITDIILGKEKIDFSSNNKKWNDGVLVPNFVFNRLDYQLWKLFQEQEQEQEQKVEILSGNDKWLTIKNKEAIWKKFRFTFRSSVEHHYPQHPSEEHGLEKLDKKTLDNFGNLYLLSQSKNSRLSNLTPKAKCSYYEKNENYDSLKQAIMMSYDKWEENEIKEHGKEMLKILNQPLSKADS